MVSGKLPLLLAALLLVLSFGLEFHHHDDGKPHTDCSLCTAAQHTQSASVTCQESGLHVAAQTSLELPPSLPEPVAVHLDVPVIRPPPASIPA